MRRELLAAAIALAAASCTTGICARNSDCAAGQVCTATGRCVVPADASVDSSGSATVVDAMIDAAGAR